MKRGTHFQETSTLQLQYAFPVKDNICRGAYQMKNEEFSAAILQLKEMNI